jgi:hypothetical protein
MVNGRFLLQDMSFSQLRLMAGIRPFRRSWQHRQDRPEPDIRGKGVRRSAASPNPAVRVSRSISIGRLTGVRTFQPLAGSAQKPFAIAAPPTWTAASGQLQMQHRYRRVV